MRLAFIAARLCLVTSVLLISAGGCGFSASAASVVDPPNDPNAYECSCSCENPDRGLTSTPARSNDDAEQVLPNDVAVLNGNNLDLADDNNVPSQPQLVGIRFPNIGIPRGATIVSANVQFTASQTATAPSTLTLRGQAADDAPSFSATNGNLSGRPLTTASAAWSPPGWNPGDAGPGQLTTNLSSIVSEIILRPGWKAGNAMVLIISGVGHRAAVSFDSNPARAPQLNLVYRDPATNFDVHACMPASLDPNIGPKAAPGDDALKADCQQRIENTVRGMTLACGYPSNCNCDVTKTTRRFVQKCDDPCAEVTLTPGCTNFSPSNGVVVATNAPGDTPVCTTGSPLAAAMFGRRSACQVTGTATVHISDQTKTPAASGLVEIEGTPCPGASCAVGVQYGLDLDPIKFSSLFGSATFQDLAAAGESRSGGKAVLDAAGNGAFAPQTIGISARGRRGSETAAAVGANNDDVGVGVDWTPGSAVCALDGAVIGTTNPELKRCENAGPDANKICDTDDDCADDPDCTDGDCNCLNVQEEAGMTLALSLQGPLVNQPPASRAGVDQVVECNQPGSASFTLDGTASSDPDNNIASFAWFLNGRSAAELFGFTPRVAVQQALGTSALYLLRVVDQGGQADEDTTLATVVDTTAPVIDCNAPATITPPGTPVSFTATATDVCDPAATPTITGFTCFRFTGSGKVVDKTNSCAVITNNNRITIAHSNGVGNHIEWTTRVTDASGNVSQKTCAVEVVRP